MQVNFVEDGFYSDFVSNDKYSIGYVHSGNTSMTTASSLTARAVGALNFSAILNADTISRLESSKVYWLYATNDPSSGIGSNDKLNYSLIQPGDRIIPPSQSVPWRRIRTVTDNNLSSQMGRNELDYAGYTLLQSKRYSKEGFGCYMHNPSELIDFDFVIYRFCHIDHSSGIPEDGSLTSSPRVLDNLAYNDYSVPLNPDQIVIQLPDTTISKNKYINPSCGTFQFDKIDFRRGDAIACGIKFRRSGSEWAWTPEGVPQRYRENDHPIHILVSIRYEITEF